MKFSRAGESLWMEWDGFEYPSQLPISSTVIYYTEGWVDFRHDVVLRALASSIQRDGVAVDIGDAYRTLDGAVMHQARAVHVGGEFELSYFDEEFDAHDPAELDKPRDITWVEVPHGR